MKALIMLLAFAGLPAYAGDTYCAPVAEMLDTVTGEMGQVPVFVGKEPNGAVVTIFVDPRSGRWVAVVIAPNGMSCAPASGAEYKVQLPGSPA